MSSGNKASRSPAEWNSNTPAWCIPYSRYTFKHASFQTLPDNVKPANDVVRLLYILTRKIDGKIIIFLTCFFFIFVTTANSNMHFTFFFFSEYLVVLRYALWRPLCSSLRKALHRHHKLRWKHLLQVFDIGHVFLGCVELNFAGLEHYRTHIMSVCCHLLARIAPQVQTLLHSEIF